MFFRKLFLLLIVLSFVSTKPLVAQSTNNTLLNRAEEAFQNERWKSAGTLYNLLLSDSTNYTPLIAKAILSDVLSEDELNTKRVVSQFVKNKNRIDSLLNDFSLLCIQTKHFDAYETALVNVAIYQPAFADTLISNAIQYRLFLREAEKALDLIEKQLALVPSSVKYLLFKAKAYQQMNDSKKAIEVYQHILEINPKQYDALLYCGNYYYQKGDEEMKAIEEAYSFLEKPTQMEYADYRNALLLNYQTFFNESLSFLEKANAIHSTPFVIKTMDQIHQFADLISKEEKIKTKK